MVPTAIYARAPRAVGHRYSFAFHAADPPAPRLPARVRTTACLRHPSRSTEAAYIAWIRRNIVFHGKRHPGDVATTQIYTHVLNPGPSAVKGPTDKILVP